MGRATAPLLLVAETSAVSYRHTWRGSVFSTLLSPVLFLAAMGAGLGTLIDDGSGARSLGDVDYLTFLAPGLLAATAMQTGASEAAYPVMAGIKWNRVFHAMLATPIRVVDIALGTMLWIGIRLLMGVVIFAGVIVVFGAASSPWLLVALPAAVLTGLAHASPVMAYTAGLDSDAGLATLFRFVIVPLFLFSGAFFPITQLPAAVQPIAYATPLWHGVDLCRSLALGHAELLASIGHAAYLAAWAIAGCALAVRRLERRLVT